MTASLFIGLDVGTQGTKAVAFDPNARSIVGRAARSYDLLPNLPQGAAEQHPETWVLAVAEAVGELMDSGHIAASSVAGIGVSGQQHGAVVLDDRGEVLRPAKLWCDTSTTAEAAELSRALGRPVPTGFTAPKLLWLKRHEPFTWARAKTVLLPHDYVNFRLTGQMAMEAGDASGTGFFDTRSRTFDHAAMAVIDGRLPGMLPRLIPSHEAAGTLSQSGARLLGLSPGVLVASGGGDNMMSAIGSGATRPGVVTVSLGTSGTAFCHSAAPVEDPDGLIANFCDSTGGYLPLLCTMNVTTVTEEVRHLFPTIGIVELNRLAEGVAPGSDGLLFLPYLRGERVPDLPHATGALLGVTAESLSPGRLFRAAMEGATLALASGIERMRRLGIAVDAVRVVGGGAKSMLWRQILADCLDVPVQGLAEEESAAFGAALQALWAFRVAAGERIGADDVARAYVELDGSRAEPNPAARDVYRAARERLEKATEKLFRY